ncbi:MAG: PDZ domain-containing protein [Planctomycetes bacterium]|jgi:serine protease Do|nr:trypsin-like peptidase domain-containing protein [Phycisphaerae bacterium]NBB95019.1 PDZ domain-containing protein [Planctomycetota bacterium]
MNRVSQSLVLILLAFASAVLAADSSPPAASADPVVLPPAMEPQASDFREIVRRAKDQVFPAVVFVKCLQESHEMGKKVTQEVLGSGVVITPDGQALTNWHVIDKAVEVRCLLWDGTALDAEIIGEDKDTDLALLQMDLSSARNDAGEPDARVTPLPHAKLGDSTKLVEGDFVMAMGAPYGLNRSVSIGIISCTRRYLPGSSEYSKWLQTDASINPGNSGGPLVNTAGEIIGINTRGGGSMGFAIPSETVKIIVEQLRRSGKVDWSWTGLQIQPLKDFNKNIYFKGTTGFIVAETDPESPARRAGIKVRDRIVKINGQPVTATWEEDLPAIRRMLGMLEKGKPATFLVERDGEAMDITLTPREKGDVEGEELDCPRWDLTVKAINQFDNPDLHYFHKEGVFVYGVKYPGNASESGLHEKDIILRIGEDEVKTLEDVESIHQKALADIDNKHRILFTVERNGLMKQIVLNFQRDYEKE